MSYFKAPVLDDDALSSTDVLVWYALCSFASWRCDPQGNPIRSKPGSCFPPLEKLAERTHLTERSIRKALRRLEAAGYVRTEATYADAKRPDRKGKQKQNDYTLFVAPQRPREAPELVEDTSVPSSPTSDEYEAPSAARADAVPSSEDVYQEERAWEMLERHFSGMVSEKNARKWFRNIRRKYPGVTVYAEVDEAARWIKDNPSRVGKIKNVLGFMTNWVKRVVSGA